MSQYATHPTELNSSRIYCFSIYVNYYLSNCSGQKSRLLSFMSPVPFIPLYYINTISKAYPQCILFSPISSYHLCLSYHNLLPGLPQRPPNYSPRFCSCHPYNLFSIWQLKYLKNTNQTMSLSCLKPSMAFPPEFKIKSKLLSLIYKGRHGLTLACVSDFTC